MKGSTLKGKSRSLKIVSDVADGVRNGNKYIIKPLLSHEVSSLDDYYYFKERYKDEPRFTTKETAYTYVQIISNKVVNVKELTPEDYKHLHCENQEQFIDYYNDIIRKMSSDINNRAVANRFIRDYSYDKNPCVELLELEIVNPTN